MLALSVFFLLFGTVIFCAATYYILELEAKAEDGVRLADRKVVMYFRVKRKLNKLIKEYDQAVDGKYNHPVTGRFCSREDFYKAVFHDA